MTKTEAAETLAIEVNVWCRRVGQTPTLDIVWGRMSELAAGHRGDFLARAAKAANGKTVLRIARDNWVG